MEEKQMYDDAFYVEKQRWGTWKSFDKEGNALVTSMTEENTVRSTRYYLQLKQENKLNDVEVTYSSTVDGKL